MPGCILVFIGGGLGAALRHGVNGARLAYFGSGFLHGTLLVNIAGGLLMRTLVLLSIGAVLAGMAIARTIAS